ncbi:MAG: FAD-binding oxidoreductase, partial [bacterium]
MVPTDVQTRDIDPPSIDGVVRTDSTTRQLYSTDASIYELEPEFVFFPFNKADVKTIHEWSAETDVSIIPRGAGTSLSGQSIGQGAVVDYSRHINDIIDRDPDSETVTVEPGVVLEHLNDFLAQYDRQFGPDVATANRATIGGMIGNNSAGAHSIRYGYTAQHVESITTVLPGGEKVTFEPISMEEASRKAKQKGPVGRLYDKIPEFIRSNSTEIETMYPDLLRNVSGYGLDRFLEKLQDDVVDFTELICGSEGTLGAVVEAELSTVPAIDEKNLIVVNCDSLRSAVSVNRRVVEESPLAIELLDRTLLELAEDSLEISRYMDWLTGDPEAILIVEVGSEVDGPSLQKRVETIRRAIDSANESTSVSVVRDPEQQQNVWKVRKSGLPLLLGISDDRKPTTFVEDTAVDPSRLAGYVRDFQDIVEDYNTTAAFYGHISVGCLHIRPLINLKSASGVSDMKEMTGEIVELVKEYNGALSGEHGDGRSRSEWLDDFYGEPLVSVFNQVKETFDPDRRFSPGNIVEPQSMTENLRFGADYEVQEWDIQQDFSEQGG